MLLLFIKKILLDDVEGREKNVKLILMSATLNAEKFSQYFVTKKHEYENNDDDSRESPIIKIPSYRRFNIQEVFLDEIVPKVSYTFIIL